MDVESMAVSSADPASARVAWSRRISWIERRSTRIIGAVAALVLVVEIVYAGFLGDQLRYLDERVYVTLADNLVNLGMYTQDGVNPTAYRPPGYPMILGALQFVGAGVVGMRLLNAVLLALVVVAVAALARLLAGRLAAVLAAVITGCYPLFIYTAGTLYPQTMAMLLLVSGILALVVAARATTSGGSGWLAMGGGICFGMLVLTVPTFAVSFGAMLVWLALSHRRVALRVSVIALAAALVLPAAWSARNAVQLGGFVPFSTNGGINLLLGNSEDAHPGGGRLADLSRYEDEAQRRNLTEIGMDHFYQQSAIAWIKEHKWQALVLYLGKVLNNFSVQNELATSGRNSTAQTLLLAVTYLPLLLLFAVRLALALRPPQRLGRLEALLVALVLANALLLAVYYTRIRFRVPLDALMIAVDAALLATLARRWSGTGSPEPAAVRDVRSR
jgi:4-amino-4-deoxy-L-arabinose transferase-like glycosyltransferase